MNTDTIYGDTDMIYEYTNMYGDTISRAIFKRIRVLPTEDRTRANRLVLSIEDRTRANRLFLSYLDSFDDDSSDDLPDLDTDSFYDDLWDLDDSFDDDLPDLIDAPTNHNSIQNLDTEFHDNSHNLSKSYHPANIG